MVIDPLRNAEKKDLYANKRYEAYITQRRILGGVLTGISERHDRTLLAVGSGGIALSVTFLEKIAPNPPSWSLYIIGGAWIFLIASVMLQIYTLKLSEKAIYRQMELLDSEYAGFVREAKPPRVVSCLQTETKPNPSEKAAATNAFTLPIRRYDTWSHLSLCFGLTLFCLFAGINLRTKTVNKVINESRPTSRTAASPRIPAADTSPGTPGITAPSFTAPDALPSGSNHPVGGPPLLQPRFSRPPYRGFLYPADK